MSDDDWMKAKPSGIREDKSKLTDQEFMDQLSPGEYTCCFWENFVRISLQDYNRLVGIAKKGMGNERT